MIIFKRDGGYFKGSYAGFVGGISHHRFLSVERIRDQVEKKYFIMQNETTVPVSNIIDFKFTKNVWEDTPDEYYTPPQAPAQDQEPENGSNDSKQF